MQNSLYNISLLTIINTVLSNNLFLFLAKNTPEWDDENLPPSTVEITSFSDKILFLKKISTLNVRFMITRENWVIGNYNINDIIITSDFNVYQCVTSGSSGIKPNHLSGSIVDSSGTAYWKFLETVSLNDRTEYLTETLVPLTFKSENLFFINSSEFIKEIKIHGKIIGSEDGKLPLDRLYRIVGLYANPLNRDERTDSFLFQNNIKNYGTIISYKTLSPINRTEEQIITYSFSVPL